MITNRLLQVEDYPLLLSSMEQDEYHYVSPLFFVEDGTITSVYEDDKGPVMFVRGKGFLENNDQILQLDIQYVSNHDKRNLKVMSYGFPELAAKAKINGFSEIRFNSSVGVLRKFCIKKLGFEAADEQMLRFVLNE
jgi:hypothetical protein